MRRRDHRTLAALGLGVCLGVTMGASAAWAQNHDQPVIVTVPSGAPMAPATPAPQRRGDEIRGIRIESNGALITGPLNARRVYIPLDTPHTPQGFRSLWVGAADLCPSAVSARRSGEAVPPDGVVLIGENEIIGRQRVTIVQLFVPLPSTFTLAMLESGRRLQLKNSDYRDAAKVLAIGVKPDGSRDYLELTLSEDGNRLVLEGRGSRENALRCTG